MPLTLITGPANASKAGAVLERLRAALSRDPALVVPTSADATHYLRELAGAGIVFGAEVTTFPRLMRDLARAAGVRIRPLGRLARHEVVKATIADSNLTALAASARGPGFAAALGDLFAELQRSLVTPARFTVAVRAWQAAGTAPAHAGELAALYSAYHARLGALKATDSDGLTHAALNAVRDVWSARPLFLYGFDELLPTQLDLVETLVRHTEAEVCVALTYEPGRAALAGSAPTVELLKPLAREHITLQPRSEHYAPSARGALHHLERGLFEPDRSRVPPNGAVRLLEAGGERAEAELVGASVLELLRDGMAPEDIAVLVRGRSATELFAQVLETYEIPVAFERRTPFAQTRLGTGLLAFARAATPAGTAMDVVTWLRTPGKLGATNHAPGRATPTEPEPGQPGSPPTRADPTGSDRANRPASPDDRAPSPAAAVDSTGSDRAERPASPDDRAPSPAVVDPTGSDRARQPAPPPTGADPTGSDRTDQPAAPPAPLGETAPGQLFPSPGGAEPTGSDLADRPVPPPAASGPAGPDLAGRPAAPAVPHGDAGPGHVFPSPADADAGLDIAGRPAPSPAGADAAGSDLAPAAPLEIAARGRVVATPVGSAAADLADRLEVLVRRSEARTAREARRLWERLGGRELTELDELAAAEDVLPVLLAEAEAIWTAPHVRGARVLTPEAERDARAARELRAAVSELTRLAEADPALAQDPLEALKTLEVRESEPSAEGVPGVLLADPLAIRARRFRAVFVCGLQEGELPQRPLPEPFLDDGARAALAIASGLVLPRHEDTLARERSLFYACVSRPEEALFLSFRSSDEEGGPQQPSPFLDDVRALFTDELWSGRGRRLLAEVTWPPAEAPTPHELRRAQAATTEKPAPAPLGAPESPGVHALLAARDRESARGLETFAGCPVKWMIEHLLRPDPVDPDPAAMRRGSLGHAVLERTLRGLKTRTGTARLTPDTQQEALRELNTAIGELSAAARNTAGKAAARALEVDLQRYLRHECATGAGYEPTELEWSFDDLMIDGVAVGGRVDRIDTDGTRAIVRDYKGKTVHAGARWAEDGKIQAALYALAVRERFGVELVGALYQPIGSADQRPRGIVRDDVPGRYVNGDATDAATLELRLQESRAVAAQAATDLRAGRIRPCPDRCAYNGGCAHPGICRA